MRYIPIRKLRDAVAALNWDDIEQNHLTLLGGMTKKERSEYFKVNTDWNILQPMMFELSHGKCWYSEAPIGAGEFAIDHFRPKNRSKNNDGKPIRTDGYWWLAYSWINYRLIGGLCNIRRKDRLGEDEEVKGKGDYFPLDLVNGAVCEKGDNLEKELPLLLDPCNEADIGLISFDKSGEPIPAGDDDEDIERAKVSIFFYHLDLEQLNLQRKQVWEDCETEINDGAVNLKDAPNKHSKRQVLRKIYARLLQLTSEKSPFSVTARACIIANYPENKWLAKLIRTL